MREGRSRNIERQNKGSEIVTMKQVAKNRERFKEMYLASPHGLIGGTEMEACILRGVRKEIRSEKKHHGKKKGFWEE